MRNGNAIVKLALDQANSPEHSGHGYTVRIRTASGDTWQGAVKRHNYQSTSECHAAVLTLEVWEVRKGTSQYGDHPQRTDREVYIDPDTVESIEIIW